MRVSHFPLNTLVVAGLLVFGGSTFTPAAQAGVFAAFAEATLAITAIESSGDQNGLFINGYGYPDAGLSTEGAGTATAFADVDYDPSGLLPPWPGDNGFATASTSGAATDDPDYAEGFGDAFLFVDILNGSSAIVDITFAFDWSLSASALAVTSNGDAIADAFIDLFIDGLVIDGPAALYEEVVADALGLEGPNLDEKAGSTAFTVSVGPDGIAYIDVVSSAFGAAVPAPSVLALMTLGLGLLGVRRRIMPASSIRSCAQRAAPTGIAPVLLSAFATLALGSVLVVADVQAQSTGFESRGGRWQGGADPWQQRTQRWSERAPWWQQRAVRWAEPPLPAQPVASGSACLIGGSAVGGGCVVTSQQPVLQIPGAGSGNVYIVDGSAPDQNNAWVSPSMTLSPSSRCGGSTCYPVPAAAGLLPRHSYQWAFVPSGGSNDLSWQGFTIDYVRAGREPSDSFGPLTIGLASGTVQTALQTQAVQTASGTVQIGLSHRGGYTGTPTGEPWFPEDPAGALPVGWVFTGVDANVPWVRISAVDALGGSGTRAVTLEAFDGSLLEYTNTDGGSGGWAPPVGVGRPANDYGTLAQSSDGSTFTWTSGTSVVTFVQSANDTSLWLASQSQQVLPGAGDKPSPGLQVSWDDQGRLASIADQSSLDSNGEPTRVAHFYYGGDNQCTTPSGSGLIAAPAGLLCAFAHLDGSRAEVYYRALATSFGDVQLGQVALPGGAIWSFEWQTASYTLTNNTRVTAPQLVSVQTPRGHDAAGAGTVAADDSKWWVIYDPFFGLLQGFVSPLPGAGEAANERLGRYYTLATGANPGQAQIAWGMVSGSAGNFSLSAGAKLQGIGFDSAWRRTSVETVLDADTSYTATYSWDPSIDRQTGVSFAGASQSQAYDFLGRPSTITGPGASVSTTRYDQDGLAGWIATFYGNSTLSAPGVTSEAVNSAAVGWTSAPTGISGGSWSLQISTYLEAPAAGGNVAYRLSSDAHGSATLWVNGQCDASASDCGSDNIATPSVATAAGDALNLMVQYVRDGTAVSGSAPVSIQVEQQVNGGNWTALTLADLDPGTDLQSTVSSTDTLSPGGSAVTLTRTTTWADALFGTQAGVTYPGLEGNLMTTPGYEADYDPTNSLWKRLSAQTSAGRSTYGLDYWANTAVPTSPACENTANVIQAGQLSSLTYPEASSGAASGLSRQLTYDAAGRKAALEVIPPGESSGVIGCLRYDARGRMLEGQVLAYSDSASGTGGGEMSKTWAYSADGLTTTLTHTFEAPPEKPACASESSAPYTCTEQRTIDLLGRTVASTDVWATRVETDYQPDPASGTQTTTTTTTAGSFTATSTVTSNRDGTAASLTRTDTANSPTLSAVWRYDAYGRTETIVTDSGSAEVITASYDYDDQGRVDSLTWSRGGNPLVANTLTLSPNSGRTLGETLSVNGTDYAFAYRFNSAGWLTAAALTGGVSANWGYGFDAVSDGTNPDAYLNGNVTAYSAQVGSNSDDLTFGYDYLDRIESSLAGSSVGHDVLGNLTAYGDLALVYEQTNQLIEAKVDNTTTTFERTPDGNLYRKVTASDNSSTAIRYAASGLILDDGGSASSQTLRIGTLLATFDLAAPGQVDYTVTTLQGGHALLALDAQGQPQNLAAPSLYGPWGEAINPPAADPARPLYGWQATNLLETSAGLVLMGERAYLPALGRFTSLDPVFAGGINSYNYANNDPINNNDPNGTLSTATELAIGFGSGVGVVGILGAKALADGQNLSYVTLTTSRPSRNLNNAPERMRVNSIDETQSDVGSLGNDAEEIATATEDDIKITGQGQPQGGSVLDWWSNEQERRAEFGDVEDAFEDAVSEVIF